MLDKSGQIIRISDSIHKLTEFVVSSGKMEAYEIHSFATFKEYWDRMQFYEKARSPMTTQLYRIAPLKWDREHGDDELVYSSRSINSSTYYVRFRDFKWDAYIQCGGGHGGSGQSFGSFLDLEAAQAACQSQWEQTLSQYLEKVEIR